MICILFRLRVCSVRKCLLLELSLKFQCQSKLQKQASRWHQGEQSTIHPLTLWCGSEYSVDLSFWHNSMGLQTQFISGYDHRAQGWLFLQLSLKIWNWHCSILDIVCVGWGWMTLFTAEIVREDSLPSEHLEIQSI